MVRVRRDTAVSPSRAVSAAAAAGCDCTVHPAGCIEAVATDFAGAAGDNAGMDEQGDFGEHASGDAVIVGLGQAVSS